MWCLRSAGCCQPVAYRLTDVCYVMFVNMVHSVHFYFINTTVLWVYCFTNEQAGWFLRPDCAPSSECPRASIAARRCAAGSISISRRASRCCSSAIAGIAIGANFKIYLLVSFVRIESNFFKYTGDTDAKNDGPEFWNSNSVIFENFFLNFQKASHGTSAADLDHYGRGQTRSQ